MLSAREAGYRITWVRFDRLDLVRKLVETPAEIRSCNRYG